jgi:AcrR family transcriptional regulator
MTETDRRTEILDAALRAFATHGYHKASIKLIAREAGLKSSSHLYWYFADKRDLFKAVINERSPLATLPLADPDTVQSVMDQPPEQVLSLIAHGFLSVQDNPDVIDLLRLYISEAVRDPEVAELIAELQTHMVNLLTTYLRHQVKIGALREHNVDSAARAFMGTIIANLFGNQIFRAIAAGFPDRSTYIAHVIDIFMKGLQP